MECEWGQRPGMGNKTGNGDRDREWGQGLGIWTGTRNGIGNMRQGLEIILGMGQGSKMVPEHQTVTANGTEIQDWDQESDMESGQDWVWEMGSEMLLEI